VPWDVSFRGHCVFQAGAWDCFPPQHDTMRGENVHEYDCHMFVPAFVEEGLDMIAKRERKRFKEECERVAVERAAGGNPGRGTCYVARHPLAMLSNGLFEQPFTVVDSETSMDAFEFFRRVEEGTLSHATSWHHWVKESNMKLLTYYNGGVEFAPPQPLTAKTVLTPTWNLANDNNPVAEALASIRSTLKKLNDTLVQPKSPDPAGGA